MKLVQQGIDNVGDWVKDNNLYLNSSKCKFMRVSKLKSGGINFKTQYLSESAGISQIPTRLGVTIVTTSSWYVST